MFRVKIDFGKTCEDLDTMHNVHEINYVHVVHVGIDKIMHGGIISCRGIPHVEFIIKMHRVDYMLGKSACRRLVKFSNSHFATFGNRLVGDT